MSWYHYPETITLNRGYYTTCTINLNGGLLTSWRIQNKEQLFNSRCNVYNGLNRVHAGIQILFPVYGSSDLQVNHGFARRLNWTIEQPPEVVGNEDIQATFSLGPNDYTRSMWNHSFKLSWRVTLYKSKLDLEFGVMNTDQHYPFMFNFVSRTYIQVPDIEKSFISGLEECEGYDQIEKKSFLCPDGKFHIDKLTKVYFSKWPNNFTLNNVMQNGIIKVTNHNLPEAGMWNPFGKFQVRGLDMNEYLHKLCVECGYLKKPLLLHPGETFLARQTLDKLDRDISINELFLDDWFKDICV